MTSILRRISRGLILVVAATGVAWSAEIPWGGSEGDWDVGANWEGGSVPGASDDAVIANYGTALLPAGSAGTVQTLRLPFGTVKLAGGTLNASSVILSGNSEFHFSYGTLEIGSADGPSGTLNATTIDGGPNIGGLIFKNSDTFTTGANISGGVHVAQFGTGTTILTGDNTYTGATSVYSGRIMIGSANALPRGNTVLFFGGGTLDTGSHPVSLGLLKSYTNLARVEFGADFTVDQTSVSTFSGTIVGTSGSFRVLGPGQLTLSGNTTIPNFTMLGTSETTLAGTTVVSGQTQAYGGSLLVTGSLTTASIRIGDGTFGLGAGSLLQIGGLNTITRDGTHGLDLGGGTIRVVGSDLSVDTPITVTWDSSKIDTNGFNATFSGQLSGNGALTKIGEGRLTLSGASTLSGEVTVKDGALAVTGSLPVTSTTVEAAGTLEGTGIISSGLPTSMAAIHGTLAPGVDAATGLLTFGGRLTLFPESFTDIDIRGTALSLFDRISVAHLLTYSGTLNLTFSGGFFPQAGDTFQIFKDFDSSAGSFVSIGFSNPHVIGSFDYASGTLSILSVPEPSVCALAIAGMLAFVVVFHHRSRVLGQ